MLERETEEDEETEEEESENYSDNNEPTGSNDTNFHDSEIIDSDFEANADEVISYIRIHYAKEDYLRYSTRVNFGRPPNRYGY